MNGSLIAIFIIFFICICIPLFGIITGKVRERNKKKKESEIEIVKQTSTLYNQYEQVRNNYNIYIDIPESYLLCRDYKSWKSYTSADMFTTSLLLIEEDTELRMIAQKIQHNREVVSQYQRAIESYSHADITHNVNLPLPQKKYSSIENELIAKIKKPPIEIKITVKLRYINREGECKYWRECSLDYYALQDAYRGIDNKKILQAKAAIERSKLSANLRYNVLKRDGFRCSLCGATQADGVKLHVDHILPVSKGGKTEMENLRTLCDRCNLGKGAKYDPNGLN